MPKPLAICLENLDAPSPAERYLRCVAVVGRQLGLRVDPAGAVVWRGEGSAACELWVSQDDRLILLRPEGAPPVIVRRAGRTLEAPEGKPVVLLDQDEFDVGPRRLKVHVHGVAPAVAAPSFLQRTESAKRGGMRTAAAAVALGFALSGSAGIEVRCSPPAPPEPPNPDPGREDAGAPPPEDASATQDIEVRIQPPEAPAQIEPSPPPEPVEPLVPPEPIEVREAPPDIEG